MVIISVSTVTLALCLIKVNSKTRYFLLHPFCYFVAVNAVVCDMVGILLSMVTIPLTVSCFRIRHLRDT